MIKTLNIVNGDTCINIMKEAKITGDFLAWRDFLHEGSVPANLTLEELSIIRAKFISDYGFGKFENIKKDFEIRDRKLNNYKLYEKIVLWFEHDLYDQLQLIQLLSWFSSKNLGTTKLTLICSNNYLGESSTQQIKKLLDYETDILKEHFSLAQKSWLAFRHNTPKKWAELLNDKTALLPFLKGAIYRMLEEYPNVRDGLPRSEYQALLVISNGKDTPLEIFMESQKLEERKFMGDSLFWKILENFESYNVIERKEGKLIVTSLGKKLLKGEENWLNIKPIQRSIGGVNLTNENLWCWDSKEKVIENYYFSKTLNMLLKVK